MVTTSANVGAPAVGTGVILTKTQRQSAFARQTPIEIITQNGAVYHTFSAGKAVEVGEGELKPLTEGTVSNVTLKPVVLAYKDVMTKQADEALPALKERQAEVIAAAFGGAIDEKIAKGTSTDYDALTGVDTITVTDEADLYAALGQVASTGVSASGWVLSTALYWNLVARKTSLGVKEIAFSGTEAGGDLTLLGLPVTLFTDAALIGFTGPFATRAVYGEVEGYPDFTEITEAITLNNGTVVTLKDKNQIGLLAETKFAFKVASKSEFRKIVVTPASA